MFKCLTKPEVPQIDAFDCYYCKKRSTGKWCLHCNKKPVRGLYWDQFGYECKPTARIKPCGRNEVNIIGY